MRHLIGRRQLLDALAGRRPDGLDPGDRLRWRPRRLHARPEPSSRTTRGHVPNSVFLPAYIDPSGVALEPRLRSRSPASDRPGQARHDTDHNRHCRRTSAPGSVVDVAGRPAQWPTTIIDRIECRPRSPVEICALRSHDGSTPAATAVVARRPPSRRAAYSLEINPQTPSRRRLPNTRPISVILQRLPALPVAVPKLRELCRDWRPSTMPSTACRDHLQ